jgi:hypothetical protein
MKTNEITVRITIATGLVLIISFMTFPVFGYDITDKFSIDGVLAGTPQYQQVSDAPGTSDKLKAGLAIQPEMSFRPTEVDEFFLKVGFGVGNGLNKVSPFNLAPWAADLENDVKNINGRDRDYLLTAWYKHTFQLGKTASLGLTGGLIDATDYVDQNAFANDEYTQFLNQALINGPSGFAPSYDGGGAAELKFGNFSLNGVFMSVGKNEDGNSYQFYGAELGYRLETSLGEGNYRLIGEATSDDFSNEQGHEHEGRAGLLISFDQQLGDIFGAWIRFGWQDDQAAIDYQNLYSGGINISGNLWGREQDNIGIGGAYLHGGDLDLDSSQVAEAYARFALNEYFALTLDVQYMKDDYDHADDPKGFIYGVRMTSEF